MKNLLLALTAAIALAAGPTLAGAAELAPPGKQSQGTGKHHRHNGKGKRHHKAKAKAKARANAHQHGKQHQRVGNNTGR
ncbi:MAG: hypothetical protein K2Q09_07670 [Phycisphaerales bacterium]|nr:hypothetical protein [Phycisphaerales bacterium]